MLLAPFRGALIGLLAVLSLSAWGGAGDPLVSWNDGPNKHAIVEFVTEVTREGGPSFIVPAERVAVFDNDGTLWSEQPLYFQFLFMLDQLKAAAPQHPEWKDNEALRALVARDHAALEKLGVKPVLELLSIANSGMTVKDYDNTVRDWLATNRHPKTNRPYTDMVFKPMQELLVSARQRIQNLHRVGRVGRIHATLGRNRVRHSAGSGGRLAAGCEV